VPHLQVWTVAALPSTLQHVGKVGAPVLGHIIPYMPALSLQLPGKKIQSLISNTIKISNKKKKIFYAFLFFYVQGVNELNCMPIAPTAHFVQAERSR
jgi:hypothetical protein